MAVITRYVNTASTPGGDGTTNATAGANRAYASITEWEAAQQQNLDTGNNIAECICEGSTADTSTLSIDGWTTSAADYIEIRVEQANRHDGKWNTGKYRIESATPIRISEEYVRFKGIQAKTSSGSNETVQSFSNGGVVQFSNCVLWNPAGDVISIRTNAHTLKMWNTVGITDAASSDTVEVFHNEVISTSSILFAYNCTAFSTNATRCYYGQASSVNHFKNCLAQNTGTETGSRKCFHIGGANTFNVNYCAGNDASADDFGGTGNRINQTFTFVDSANDDFHLDGTDAGAKEFGTDLSADADIPFSDDIDGQTRGATWDIGADQVTFSGNNFTLTAAQGSFTLTGQTASLNKGYKLVAAQSSFTLTGQDIGLNKSYSLSAAHTTFALTGQTTGLEADRKLTAAQASFSLIGQATGLIAARELTASQGSFTLSGQAIALNKGYPLSAQQGAFTLTGQALAFLKGLVLGLANGSFSLSGHAINLNKGYPLTAEHGAFSLAGQAIGLTASRLLTAAQATFSLTGQTVNLLRGYILSLAQGSFSLTGQALNFILGELLTASHTTFTLTGQALNLLKGSLLSAVSVSFVLTGQDATLTYTPNSITTKPYYTGGISASKRMTRGFGF